MTDLTVGQRILLHLSLYGKYREEFECPEAVTQQGIATALGLSRSHVALELKKLLEEQRVETHLAHVQRAKSRRKVYFPRASGTRVAASMRAKADQADAQWIGPRGDLQKGRGRDLLREAGGLGRPLTAVYEGVLRGEVVDLRDEGVSEPPEGVPMVGRLRELAALRAWHADGPPLLALTGLPGIGKTTLARALFHEVEAGLWVKVLPFHRPASLVAALAHALADRGRSRLLAYLKGTPPDYGEVGILLSREAAGLLLVFDDVGAAPEAAQFLRLLVDRPPPESKLLLTARRPPDFLKATDRDRRVEELRLHGLTVPEIRSLLRDLGGDEGAAESLHERTGGHPLLLRLGGATAAIDAQQVKASLVEEILGELNPEEEDAIRRAAVFRRPFPPNGLGRVRSRTLRSLLQMGLLSEADGRFEVHDIVAPLIARESRALAQEAHRRAAAFWEEQEAWVEALHHHAALGRVGPLVRLAKERAETILERGQAAEFLQILRGLPAPVDGGIVTLQARAEDYLGQWTDALATLAAGMEGAGPRDRLPMLLLRGRIHSKRGEAQEAERAFREAEALARQEGQDLDQGQALYGLSIVMRKVGKLEEGQKLLEEALAIFRAEGADPDRGRAEMELGIIQLQAERAQEAVSWFRRSRRLLAASKVDSAYLYNNLGIAYSKLAQPQESLEAFEESVRLAEASGMVRAEGYALANASDLYVGQGEIDKALEYCDRSLAIFQGLEDPLMVSACHANRAKAARAQGRLERAEDLYQESLAALEGVDAPHSLAARWVELSELYEEMGEAAQARAYRTRAQEVLRKPDSRETR